MMGILSVIFAPGRKQMPCGVYWHCDDAFAGQKSICAEEGLTIYKIEKMHFPLD